PTRQQLAGHDPSQAIAAAYSRSGRRESGVAAMHADLMTYLPDDLLTKVDITSMAHGLECRSPFLDHKVVEQAAKIPYAYLTHGGDPKPLLTSTFPQFFPETIRKRPKMGFRVPLDHWFRQTHADYVRDTLLSDRAVARGYFQRAAIERLLDEHRQGRWNHGDRLWALLCLETWHQTFLDARPAVTAVASNGHAGRGKPHAATNVLAEKGANLT
ncbi:MAG: asparagine synthase-related protein, partial [Pirellulales bacterium]